MLGGKKALCALGKIWGDTQDEEGKRMLLRNLLISSIQITLFLWDYQVAGRANTKCLGVGAGREGRGEQKMRNAEDLFASKQICPANPAGVYTEVI